MIHVGLRVAALLVVLAALPGASPVSAQAQHGSITGTVTDDSGAVVAGLAPCAYGYGGSVEVATREDRSTTRVVLGLVTGVQPVHVHAPHRP